MKLDRVNYNFRMTVRLFFNAASHNRDLDETPRFYLKPVKLLSVERVAFGMKSKDHGYVERGHRFWGYKADWELTEEQIEYIYHNDIKLNYPYGYNAGDTASTLKYEFDVKQNETFQTFYSRYWHKNPDKQTTLRGEPFPYIDYDVNEIITLKFTKDVPTLQMGIKTWSDYKSNTTYYSDPAAISCHEKDLNVYLNQYDAGFLHYYIDGNPKFPITIHSSGSSFNFHLKSGEAYDHPDLLWPTGSDGLHSGYKLVFSTGIDGTHRSHNDAEADNTAITVQRFKGPNSYGTPIWYPHVADKDEAHEFYGQGSTKGFIVSGDHTFMSEEHNFHGIGRTESFKFNTSTADANPGSPYFSYNNATVSSVTSINISETSLYWSVGDGPTVTSWMGHFDDQIVDGGAYGGLLRITKASDSTVYAVFKINSLIEGFADHRKVSVTYINSDGTFTSDDIVEIAFTHVQSPHMDLVRGNTYVVSQEDISNVGHPMYITTESSGAGANIFSSGVRRYGAADTGDLWWTVPYEAPDTLYYGCENHQYMGGIINITDPDSALGDKPGQTVRVKFDQGTDGLMHYYSADESGMGGFMFLKRDCAGEEINL